MTGKCDEKFEIFEDFNVTHTLEQARAKYRNLI